jgi:sulfate transport system ATP-binding protein
MRIEVRSLTKRFGRFTALDFIDLEVKSGELLALLGPSGGGKTTLLRIIAGLEQADEGVLSFDGRDVTTADPSQRGVGFVFQHYALFRHMTVTENVAFGLRVLPKEQRPSQSEILYRVGELLRLVQLEGYAGRYPHQLSGGQRQRVALARALAVRPKVLLLDEPFGALDARVRVDLRRWLRRLHDETGITSVFVTHDQEEALEVADRVAILNRGRLEQVGTPAEVYQQPASAFVHHFIGQVNVFPSRADTGDDLLFVRPHDLRLSLVADAAHALRAEVRFVHAAGPQVRVELAIPGIARTFEAVLPHEEAHRLPLSQGREVFLGFSQSRVWDRASAGALAADYAI